MEFQVNGSHTPVSRDDLETLLALVVQRTTNPRAGIFGPGSISWQVYRESAVFLGAGRAALLQLAHPWVAAALTQHSRVLSDPIARFHNTFRVVFTMVFGTLEQAIRAARHLHGLHARIAGALPEDAGGWRRGSSYEANEIAALRWVHATLIESALMAYECVLPPLDADEREQYYMQSKTLSALFGIPPTALAENWAAFTRYNEQMWESGELGVNQISRSIAQKISSGAGSWVHPPRWYRALTAAWMPARFRAEFGLDFSRIDRRAAEQALRRLPGVYRRFPAAVRFVGPYREAEARLADRPASILIQYSNRLWTGGPRLPFGDV